MNWRKTYNETNINVIDFTRTLPPCEDHGYYPDGYWTSIECLFTDGKDLHKGYCFVEVENGEIEFISWHSGSEGWEIDGVTHWMGKPLLPKLDEGE